MKNLFLNRNNPFFFINTKPALITADMYQKKGEKAIRTEPGKKKKMIVYTNTFVLENKKYFKIN